MEKEGEGVKPAQGKNTACLRQDNRILVMKTVRKKPDISRGELAQVTGLSKGGLTPIVQQLLDWGLIQEQALSSPKTGRKPLGLSICPPCCFCVSIDWSRRGVTAAAVDFSGKILRACRTDFQAGESLEQALEKIRRQTEKMLCQPGAGPVVGIGLVAPGPIDRITGTILSPPSFHGWRDIPIQALLGEWFSLPVWVENNARAHALAERDYGYGKSYPTFFHMVVDEGIGGAFVLNGELYTGARGFGGEIGHMSLEMSGPQCGCGNTGCAEQYATVPRLIQWINGKKREWLMEGKASGPLEIQWEQTLSLLEESDPCCLLGLEREACILGRLLVNLWNLLDPEVIVIGSQLAQAGNFLSEPLQKWMEHKVIGPVSPKVLLSQLQYPSLLGGAAMVWERFLLMEPERIKRLLELK